MSDFHIALSDLNYGPEEEEAVLRVLKRKWLSMGPEVQAFEREFAEMLKVRHAFAVSNATAALHLSFLALELGPGDEIIQPALNFVATANMTVASGATPVFADIVSLTEPTIGPMSIEQLITPRTKAIVVMHYGGYLCRMAEIMEICKHHSIALIEDACHAVGAAYLDPDQQLPHGIMAGAMGDVSAFSFFSNKNLATGEGGMVVTDRDDLAARLRLLRSHGMTTLTWDRHKGHANTYEVIENGYNYRLDDMHAAMGREQLKKLGPGNQKRREWTEMYRELLRDLDGWSIPFDTQPGDSACHLMTVIAPDNSTRNNVVAKLQAAGIQTSLHYPCITDFSAFSAMKEAPVPSSREFAGRMITLPMHPNLGEDAVKEVASALRVAANSLS